MGMRLVSWRVCGRLSEVVVEGCRLVYCFYMGDLAVAAMFPMSHRLMKAYRPQRQEGCRVDEQARIDEG
jgi:hypothetical protein